MTASGTDDRRLRSAFREAVLALGGVFATQQVDDKVVGVAARALDRVVGRHLCSAAGMSSSMDTTNSPPHLRPHPAIAELLARIGVSRPAPADDRDHEWLRLPGLFRRWEFEQVIDVDEEYLVEDAGKGSDGTPLFAIYSRPHAGKEVTP